LQENGIIFENLTEEEQVIHYEKHLSLFLTKGGMTYKKKKGDKVSEETLL
jgi:transposase